MVSSLPLLFITALPTPNRNHKRGNRRVRQNKAPGSDAITLSGRQSLISVSTNATTAVPIYLDPTAFGDRVAAIGTNFVRFRIKSLRFQYRSSSSSSNGGLLTYGVLDDFDPGSTVVPTNRDQILNFRRATENNFWRNSNLSWRPLDPQKWYYVVGGNATNGDRFTVPATLYYVSSGADIAESGFLDVVYVIEFAGAATTSLTSTSSVLPNIPGTPRPSQGFSGKEDSSGYVSIAKPLTSSIFRR